VGQLEDWRFSAAKGIVNKVFIAAVNRCATQKQVQLRVFPQMWSRALPSGRAGTPVAPPTFPQAVKPWPFTIYEMTSNRDQDQN
jgi:hypothetical protein